MESLVHRVVRRFLASKALAKTLPDYIRLVAEDGAKIAKWKVAFIANTKRDVKAAHDRVLSEVKRGPYPPQTAAYFTKDATAILTKMDKALDDIDRKFVRDAGSDLDHAFHAEHDEHWDPEMFADGQTKADYSPKTLDPLFDVCIAAVNKYSEFWQRFEMKWPLGSMNVTLDSLLPASMHQEGRINMQWLKDSHELGLDVAFANYHRALEALLKKVGTAPPSEGSAHSLQMGLSALINEAKKAGDKWTHDFAHSLWDQVDHGRQLSEKQKALLNKKLEEYEIPPVNYAFRYRG